MGRQNKWFVSLLRHLFWLSAMYNFGIHEGCQISRLYDILTSYKYIPFTVDELLRHVSVVFHSSRWCKSVVGLEDSCGAIKRQGWADSTSGTYHTPMKTNIHFCEECELQPVTCDQKTVELYIPYLVDKK